MGGMHMVVQVQQKMEQQVGREAYLCRGAGPLQWPLHVWWTWLWTRDGETAGGGGRAISVVMVEESQRAAASASLRPDTDARGR